MDTVLSNLPRTKNLHYIMKIGVLFPCKSIYKIILATYNGSKNGLKRSQNLPSSAYLYNQTEQERAKHARVTKFEIFLSTFYHVNVEKYFVDRSAMCVWCLCDIKLTTEGGYDGDNSNC